MSLRAKIIASWEKSLQRKTKHPFLFSFSLLFRLAICVRNRLYDLGLLPIKKLPIPVISVGSIAAGGSGKTPLVLAIAEKLQEKTKVAILLRGYLNNDEGKLFSQRLPHVIVEANPNRFEGGMRAFRKGAKIAILDDGLQHRSLYRDLDIALNRPEEKEFLPRGFLRDERKSLERAHLILDESMVAIEVLDIIPPLHSKKVAITAAIARPKRLLDTAASLGLEVIGSLFFPDHEEIDLAALKKFWTECQAKGATSLLTTEKDIVKWKSDLPVSYIKIGIHPTCEAILRIEKAINIFTSHLP